MMTYWNRLLVAAAVLAATLAGCSKSSDEPAASNDNAADEASEAAAAAEEAKPTKEAEKPAEEAVKAEGAMAHYESLRQALVQDDTAPIEAAATALADAAAAEGNEKLASAARELAETPADDIEKVRLAFGEVSKHLVAMVEKNPELAASHHVFECPMAKGYKRWVQPGAEIENPYMGQKMLACGSEVEATKQ